jgi:hypothetical protein
LRQERKRVDAELEKVMPRKKLELKRKFNKTSSKTFDGEEKPKKSKSAKKATVEDVAKGADKSNNKNETKKSEDVKKSKVSKKSSSLPAAATASKNEKKPVKAEDTNESSLMANDRREASSLPNLGLKEDSVELLKEAFIDN